MVSTLKVFTNECVPVLENFSHCLPVCYEIIIYALYKVIFTNLSVYIRHTCIYVDICVYLLKMVSVDQAKNNKIYNI